MDKATLALAETENNAAAIRALRREINELKAGAGDTEQAQTTKHVIAFGVNGGGKTHLGEYTSGGDVILLLLYTGTSVTAVYFAGKIIASTVTPIMCRLPEGEGELYLSPARNDSKIALIGDIVQTKPPTA